MSFSFTAEQIQFRAALQRFFTDKSDTAAVRAAMASEHGIDRDAWRQACEELGLAGIRIPEQYGGAGFGYVELGIAVEEMGRHLFCAPFFSSVVLAAETILATATEPFRELLLPSIASGSVVATLAVTEANGLWDPAAVGMTAVRSGDGARLSGAKHFVLDGTTADLVLVVARDAGSQGREGLSLYLVEGASEGLQRRAVEVLDPTRRLAVLEFDDVRAECISVPGDAGAALCRALDRATIALANEMVGGSQVMLDSAVEYAKLRMQFGRPIGSFQAVKHKLADMLLDVEHAKSAAYYAAAAIDDDTGIPALAALAKATAADAYVRVAADCIQLHGGIGFTWDHDTHLWFKRAKSSEMLLGSPAWHRERYLNAIEVAA
ncbi:MAG: acyl-CoA dehydrogenase family protein [Gammaproteobacteria bacterium]|jgi:alkylation response protein AidB-like acyl-CoA dehydrogenase